VEAKRKELGLRMNVNKCKVVVSKHWKDTTEVRIYGNRTAWRILLFEKLHNE